MIGLNGCRCLGAAHRPDEPCPTRSQFAVLPGESLSEAIARHQRDEQVAALTVGAAQEKVQRPSNRPPPFVSVHAVFMPSQGEQNQWGAARWSPEKLAAIDRDGNVWGLYRDTCAPFVEAKPPVLRWLKFDCEAFQP